MQSRLREEQNDSPGFHPDPKEKRRIWDPDRSPSPAPEYELVWRKRPHRPQDRNSGHEPGDLRELLPPRGAPPLTAPLAPANAHRYGPWVRAHPSPGLHSADPTQFMKGPTETHLPPESEFDYLRQIQRATAPSAPVNALANRHHMQGQINSGHRVWAPGEISACRCPEHSGHLPRLPRVTPRNFLNHKIIQPGPPFERGRIMNDPRPVVRGAAAPAAMGFSRIHWINPRDLALPIKEELEDPGVGYPSLGRE